MFRCIGINYSIFLAEAASDNGEHIRNGICHIYLGCNRILPDQRKY